MNLLSYGSSFVTWRKLIVVFETQYLTVQKENKCHAYMCPQLKSSAFFSSPVASLKRSRKVNETTKKATRKCAKDSEQETTDYMYNTCASVDCVHPHDQDKVVDWVQCDDCDEWYHVKCTGLTLKSVKNKSAKFHCGCV